MTEKPEDYEDTVQRLASLDPQTKPHAEQLAIHMAREIVELRTERGRLAMELLTRLTEEYGGYEFEGSED